MVWRDLDQRQRRLLAGTGVFLLALLIYVQAWEPLVEARTLARERVAQQQMVLDWLEAVAPVAGQWRARRAGRRGLGDQTLLGVVDATARESGLAGALSRIEPVGDDRVRVWLDGAPFETTLGWLQQLALRHPVEFSQFSAERSAVEGQVNVRVSLVLNE